MHSPCLADLPCGVTTPTRWPGRDVKVCGGQECAGWHIVGACRTIRRLTARVRASPMAQQRKRLRVCREHHRLDRKCMAMAAPGSDRCALHHLEAFTHQRPSIAVAGCAGAALTLTPDTVRAPGAGFGRGGRSDASAIPSCAWSTARLSSPLATAITATQLGRLGKLGSAKARGRDGRDGSYSRSLISALSSRPGAPLSLTTLTSEPRTMREWRHSPATSSSIAWRGWS